MLVSKNCLRVPDLFGSHQLTLISLPSISSPFEIIQVDRIANVLLYPVARISSWVSSIYRLTRIKYCQIQLDSMWCIQFTTRVFSDFFSSHWIIFLNKRWILPLVVEQASRSSNNNGSHPQVDTCLIVWKPLVHCIGNFDSLFTAATKVG